jgi:hypothetical protein
MPMPTDLWVPLLNQHGPWVVMVFYLLYRDGQKEQATREVLDKNTIILTEMTTMLRERLPRSVA